MRSAVEAGVRQGQAINQGRMEIPLWCVQPLIVVSIAFSAVAAPATGNHVPGRGTSALRDRHDVVPRRGGRGAIGTAPTERAENVLLRPGRDWFNAARSCVSMLASLGSIGGVPAVASAVGRVRMFAASSAATYSLDRTPSSTSAAPGQSEKSHLHPLTLARIAARNETARDADVGMAVCPRLVDVKAIERQYPAAAGTLFHATNMIARRAA